MNITDVLNTIETRLDIKGTLELKDGYIVPAKALNKALVKAKHLDDLFQYHNRQWVFTNRMMSFVGEMFDRQVKTGHYKFTLE
jgi:hypothetical protein